MLCSRTNLGQKKVSSVNRFVKTHRDANTVRFTAVLSLERCQQDREDRS